MIAITYQGSEDHQQFVVDKLIPLIVGHACTTNTPSRIVAMKAFLALATILQCDGLERNALVDAIDTVRLPEHFMPKILH
ncbi:hypothetical protein EQV97_16020 [Pseudomonas sp. TMW22090]|uniref:hypothetical protein n=1 Tax=Pseudomonas sp. TMW22090 TaxID=2506434 RepID=UPI001F0DB823|nr:hypothetical protein [Pseudomonas sp. TMW22090]MCH4878885.1 hypothetical protein [Pseudomonas sp. TMW22090]